MGREVCLYGVGIEKRMNYLRLGAVAAVRGKFIQLYDTTEAYRKDVRWAREDKINMLNEYWYSREEVKQIRDDYALGNSRM